MADAFNMRGGGEIVVDHLSAALRERWDVAVLTTTRGPDGVREGGQADRPSASSAYHPRLRPIASFMNPRIAREG